MFIACCVPGSLAVEVRRHLPGWHGRAKRLQAVAGKHSHCEPGRGEESRAIQRLCTVRAAVINLESSTA